MKLKVILFFAVYLSVSTDAHSQNLLKGFQVLNIPRKSIPLGAEWIDGIGVNGQGVNEDNITSTQSISLFHLEQDFKLNLDLSILSYLGVSANLLKNTMVNYEGLKIYTIKDLSKTRIRNGQKILYEGISADSIHIKFTTDLTSQLRAQLNEKLELNINSGGDYRKGITFSGKDLFLAYRVFEIGKLKVKKKEQIFKNSYNQLKRHKTKVFEYDITLDVKDLEDCSIQPSKRPNRYGTTYLVSYFHKCEQTTPITVSIKNFENIDFLGKPLTKRFEMYNDETATLQFSTIKNNSIISDYIELAVNFYCDIERYGYLRMNDETKAIVRRITAKMNIVKKTSAPGW